MAALARGTTRFGCPEGGGPSTRFARSGHHSIRPATREEALRLASLAQGTTRFGLPRGRPARERRPNRVVRKGGLEPPRYCYRQPLKLVRLPIPPLPREGPAPLKGCPTRV